MWRCRSRQLAVAVFAVSTGAFLLLLLRSDRDTQSRYDLDVDYALETFEYLHLQRAGLVTPKPVVEAETELAGHACLFGTDGAAAPAADDGDWLSLSDAATQLYLYAAYKDDRPSRLFPSANLIVRVLAMVRRRLDAAVYCHFVDAAGRVVASSRAHSAEIWQRGWDPRDRFYVPVLLSCPLPVAVDALVSVSLSLNRCSRLSPPLPVANRERQWSSRAAAGSVVVCVKGLDFLTDQTLRFVEWFELQRLMGATTIVVYVYSVHPNMTKLLDHYSSQGLLQQVRLKLPGDNPNTPYQRSQFIWRNRQQKRRHEIIPYNDCLYRHLYSHDYALIVDTDEAVVPLQDADWPSMLRRLRAASADDDDRWTAFSIVNAFKFDRAAPPPPSASAAPAAPSHMHMLRQRARSASLSPAGVYGKSFVYVPNVVTVFNHYALHRTRPALRRTTYVSADAALKLHYKATCPVESRDECPQLLNDTVADASLDRFADELIGNVDRVLAHLHIDVDSLT